MSFAFRRGLFVASLLPLWGCPQPPQPATGPGPSPVGDRAGGPPAVAGGGADPGDQTGVMEDVVFSDIPAQFTQEQIVAGAAGKAITISGTIEGTCDGYVRVQAIEKAGQKPVGEDLITIVDVDGVDTWTMSVPAGVAMVVNGLCDANRDGKVNMGSELASPLNRFEALTENQEGVVLVLSDLGSGAPTGDEIEPPPGPSADLGTPPQPSADVDTPPQPAGAGGTPPQPAGDAGAPPQPAGDAGAPPQPAGDAGAPPAEAPSPGE